MEKINETAIYSKLHEYLCKDRTIHDIDWLKFIEKTDVVRFNKNQVIVEPGQASTHSYFIISGLMMCHEQGNHIYWFRGENDYAFTSDALSLPKGEAPKDNNEQLVALEDTVAVSIGHADLSSLLDSNHQISIMFGKAFRDTTIVFRQLVTRSTKNPQYAYEYVHEHIGFNLDRVPDGYLAKYLFTTVERLNEVREGVGK